MRSWVILTLRLALSVGLLVYLLVSVDLDLDALAPSSTSEWLWLVVAFGCIAGSLVLAAVRWGQVCHALGLQSSTRDLFWYSMAGQFLSNFVPTTIGGDVIRVRRLGRETGDSAMSFTSVILERLSGWAVLPAAVLLGFLIDPSLRDLGGATRAASVAAVTTFVALGVILLAAGNELSGRVLARYEEPLRWLHSIHEGLRLLWSQPAQIGRILGSAALYQGALIAAFWCAARAVGIESFSFAAALAFIPAVLVVQVLPLGIGGLGVREGALVLFLGSLGIENDKAVALGLTVYALTIIVSLAGLPALVFGGKNSSSAKPWYRVGWAASDVGN